MTYLLSSKTAYLLEQLLFKKDPNGPKRDYMRPVFSNGMTLIRSESQSSQMLWELVKNADPSAPLQGILNQLTVSLRNP